MRTRRPFEDFLQSWGGPAVALWGTVLLARIGVLAVPLPRWMPRVGTCVLVIVFALVGANNLIQSSRRLRPRLAHLLLRASPADPRGPLRDRRAFDASPLASRTPGTVG